MKVAKGSAEASQWRVKALSKPRMRYRAQFTCQLALEAVKGVNTIKAVASE